MKLFELLCPEFKYDKPHIYVEGGRRRIAFKVGYGFVNKTWSVSNEGSIDVMHEVLYKTFLYPSYNRTYVENRWLSKGDNIYFREMCKRRFEIMTEGSNIIKNSRYELREEILAAAIEIVLSNQYEEKPGLYKQYNEKALAGLALFLDTHKYQIRIPLRYWESSYVIRPFVYGSLVPEKEDYPLDYTVDLAIVLAYFLDVDLAKIKLPKGLKFPNLDEVILPAEGPEEDPKSTDPVLVGGESHGLEKSEYTHKLKVKEALRKSIAEQSTGSEKESSPSSKLSLFKRIIKFLSINRG